MPDLTRSSGLELSLEIQFYLVFPFIMLFMTRFEVGCLLTLRRRAFTSPAETNVAADLTDGDGYIHNGAPELHACSDRNMPRVRWLYLILVFRSVQMLSGAALLGPGNRTPLTCAQVIAAGLNFGRNRGWISSWGWHFAARSRLATDAAIGALNRNLHKLLIRRESQRELTLAQAACLPS